MANTLDRCRPHPPPLSYAPPHTQWVCGGRPSQSAGSSHLGSCSGSPTGKLSDWGSPLQLNASASFETLLEGESLCSIGHAGSTIAVGGRSEGTKDLLGDVEGNEIKTQSFAYRPAPPPTKARSLLWGSRARLTGTQSNTQSSLTHSLSFASTVSSVSTSSSTSSFKGGKLLDLQLSNEIRPDTSPSPMIRSQLRSQLTRDAGSPVRGRGSQFRNMRLLKGKYSSRGSHSGAASPVASPASSLQQNETSAFQEKLLQGPRNLDRIPRNQLEGRFLAYILHTGLPGVGAQLEYTTAQSLSVVRKAVLLNVCFDTLQSDPTFDVMMLDKAAKSLRRDMEAVLRNINTAYSFASDCTAAGKPGNEDRVLTVPHFASYYAPALELDPEAFLAIVCAGHGGSDTASTVRDMFPYILSQAPPLASDPKAGLLHAVAKTQALLESMHKESHSGSGTTLTAAYIANMDLYVANLGDSHAYVITSDGKCVCMTEHHHVENAAEREAVLARGGEVYSVRGVQRVGGLCRVTRNLGLIQVGKAVGHVPAISRRRLCPNDAYLVLATDGLWDVLKPEEVSEIVLCYMQPKQSPALSPCPRASRASVGLSASWGMYGSVLDESCSSGSSWNPAANSKTIATVLIQKAVAAGTRDNVGVTVVPLGPVQPTRLGPVARVDASDHGGAGPVAF